MAGLAPSRPDNRLRGRLALVTGASRGIGSAVALALAREGCDVAVACRSRIADAEAVAAQAAQCGVRAHAFQAELAQPDEVRRLHREVRAALGDPLVLVNNAGAGRQATLEDVGLQLWEETLAANLTSAFLLTQCTLPAMLAARWGRIVNVSSAAAQTGGVVGPHYAASKAGLLGLTRSIAARYAAEGITANAVLPALVHTDMLAARPDLTPARIPVGRFGHADEVAEAVLSALRNGYLTGQCVHLNGGSYFA